MIKPIWYCVEEYAKIRKGKHNLLWHLALPIYFLDRFFFGNFAREIVIKSLLGVKTPEQIWERKYFLKTALRMLANGAIFLIGSWMVIQLLSIPV